MSLNPSIWKRFKDSKSTTSNKCDCLKAIAVDSPSQLKWDGESLIKGFHLVEIRRVLKSRRLFLDLCNLILPFGEYIVIDKLNGGVDVLWIEQTESLKR